METGYIGNIILTVTNTNEIISLILDRIKENTKTNVFFLNAHCFNVAQKDMEYKSIINNTDFVLNDGIGVEIAAKLFDIKLKENLNGTDFVPKFLAAINEAKLKVYLLGGEEGIAEKAAINLMKEIPGLRIVGWRSGYFSDNQEVISEINLLNPDILIVGMGVPIQEKWIYNNYQKLHAKVFFGVGAFLDFASGNIRRAPRIIRILKLEWVFRLLLEPTRLWRRYLLGNFLFLYFILKEYLMKIRTKERE